jgi:hypothetical protein
MKYHDHTDASEGLQLSINRREKFQLQQFHTGTVAPLVPGGTRISRSQEFQAILSLGNPCKSCLSAQQMVLVA